MVAVFVLCSNELPHGKWCVNLMGVIEGAILCHWKYLGSNPVMCILT